MKKHLVFILMLILLPMVLAVEVVDDTLKIRIYNDTKVTNITTDLKVEFISTKDNFNNKNFTFTIDNLWNGFDVIKEFDYRVITNTTAENIDFIQAYFDCDDELDECKINLGKYDSAWDECRKDLEPYESGNATACQTDLNNCNLRVKEKDLTINSKQDKITILETAEKDKKNTKYIYGAIGLVLGFVACLYKEGKIGNTAKESAQGDFSTQQAG